LQNTVSIEIVFEKTLLDAGNALAHRSSVFSENALHATEGSLIKKSYISLVFRI
jgi:hypothetical protein